MRSRTIGAAMKIILRRRIIFLELEATEEIIAAAPRKIATMEIVTGIDISMRNILNDFA